MSEKKYIFTGEEKQEQINSRTVTLRRIKAVRSFGDVTAGDVGGWVESEDNLSHADNSWVYDDAIACDKARVCVNAQIRNSAIVCNAAIVLGNSKVLDNAVISGNALVCSRAQICDNAEITANAAIGGDSVVCCDARVADNTVINDSAEINSKEHLLVIGPVGSRNDYTTFYRNRLGGINVKCGCFSGSLENFLDKVQEVHRDNKHAMLYKVAAQLAQLQIQNT